MSTRAVYTFKDQDDTFHIYKHHDGYPTGAAEWIANAIPKAWALPRFEAAEFAAAFVAGNKERGGGVYLTTDWQVHGDLDYRYEITTAGGDLQVTAFKKVWGETSDTYTGIFLGTLADFQSRADAIR